MYHTSRIDDQNAIRKKDASEKVSALLSQAELLAEKIAGEKLQTPTTENEQYVSVLASVGWELNNGLDFIESTKTPLLAKSESSLFFNKIEISCLMMIMMMMAPATIFPGHVSDGSDPHYDDEIIYTDDDNGSSHEPVREAATDDPEFTNDRDEFSDSDGAGKNEVTQRNDNDSLSQRLRYEYSQESVTAMFVDNDSDTFKSMKLEISLEAVKPLSTAIFAVVAQTEEDETDSKNSHYVLDESSPTKNGDSSNGNTVDVVATIPSYSDTLEYKISLKREESDSDSEDSADDLVFETPQSTTQFLLDGVPSLFSPPLISPKDNGNDVPRNLFSETDLFQKIAPDRGSDQHSPTAASIHVSSSSSLLIRHPVENGPYHHHQEPPFSTSRLQSTTSRAPLMPQTTEIVVKMDYAAAVAVSNNKSGSGAELFSPELISAIEFRKMSVSSCDSFESLDTYRRGGEGDQEEKEDERRVKFEKLLEVDQKGASSAAIAIPTNSAVEIAVELNSPSGSLLPTATATTTISISPETTTTTPTANAVPVFERSPVGSWQSGETVTVCKSCRKKFTLFIRKHHCRWCGLIFCDSCTTHRVALDSPSSPPLSTSLSLPSTPRYERVCDSCHATLTNPSTTSPLFNNPRTSASPPPTTTAALSHAAFANINGGGGVGGGGMGTSPQSVASSSGSTLDVIATISSQFANAFTSVAVNTFRRGSSALAYGFDAAAAAASVAAVSDGSNTEVERQRQQSTSDSVMLECPVCQKSLLAMRT
ncbi:Pleckstrin y domain-containing F member 1, partial [Physocladia obscura]